MGRTVGLLVGRRVLRRAIAGRSSYENVKHYVSAAREHGVELLIFSSGGLNKRRMSVSGYVPRKKRGFKRKTRKLPSVVYDRSSPKRPGTSKWLTAQGVRVFNPPVRFDKYDVYQLLVLYHAARRYLPDTFLLSHASYEWFRATLAEGTEIFIKPRDGSLGKGIARVAPSKHGGFVYESRSRRVRLRSARRAWHWVRRARKGSEYIVQRGIPLAEDRGRRYDLRIPVQRDRLGDWVIPGILARRAGRIHFLTNLARGGSLERDIRAIVVRSLPGTDPDEVCRRVEQAALDIAAAIGREFPLMADLGMDMGIDRSGWPWLIEINRRPLRQPVAGVGDFVEPYHTPIGFAAYLLAGEDSRRDLASIFYRQS